MGAAPRSPRAGGGTTVRDLRWADFDELRETYYLLYEERERGESQGIPLFEQRPSVPDEVTWFANLYRRFLEGETVVVVAELGGRVVGNCVIEPTGPARASERGHVGVLGILVHRDHRGAGVGSALLDAALSRARTRFPVVRLGVYASNAHAIRLYERFGFRRVGAIPRAFRRGSEEIDEVLMVREEGPAGPADAPPRRG